MKNLNLVISSLLIFLAACQPIASLGISTPAVSVTPQAVTVMPVSPSTPTLTPAPAEGSYQIADGSIQVLQGGSWESVPGLEKVRADKMQAFADHVAFYAAGEPVAIVIPPSEPTSEPQVAVVVDGLLTLNGELLLYVENSLVPTGQSADGINVVDSSFGKVALNQAGLMLGLVDGNQFLPANNDGVVTFNEVNYTFDSETQSLIEAKSIDDSVSRLTEEQFIAQLEAYDPIAVERLNELNQKEGLYYKSGYVEEGDGKPRAVFVGEKTVINADGKEAPYAFKYTYEKGVNVWKLAPVALDQNSVRIFLPVENEWNVHINPTFSNWQGLANSIWRVVARKMVSSTPNNIDANQKVSMDEYGSHENYNNNLIRKSSSSIRRRLEAQMKQTGGIEVGRVGEMLSKGEFADLGQGLDTRFEFQATDSFDPKAAAYTDSLGDFVSGGKYRNMADVVKRRIQKGDGTWFGDELVKFGLYLNQRNGKLSLVINIDPSLIDFWATKWQDVERATDYVIGQAFINGVAASFGNELISGNFEANRVVVCETEPWFPNTIRPSDILSGITDDAFTKTWPNVFDSPVITVH